MVATGPIRLIDNELYTLVDGLEVASDEPSIRRLLMQFTKNSGFEKFAFGQIKGGHTQLYSDYPEGWQRRYLANSYFASDQVVANGRRAFRPFSWNADDMVRAGGETKRIAEEAKEFGIRYGFSIPVRTGFGGAAMLTLASEVGQPDPVALRDIAFAAAAVALIRVNLSKFSEASFIAPAIALSAREATCLAWASLGKTKAATAVMTGLSEKTVRFYLDRSMEKLSTSNIAHAVRIAVERKLI